MIDPPQHWTAYVNAWSTLAAAAAAIAVAVFAYLEIRRAAAADRSKERAADFKVSNRASALRRMISSWTMEYPQDEIGDPKLCLRLSSHLCTGPRGYRSTSTPPRSS